MRAPAFWFAPPGLASRLLAPLGAIYGAATARRMRQAGSAVGVPVISVGNFTVGGAGKTPLVAALAQELRALGRNPCVVSRGYGGSATGPLRVDDTVHDAARVGDEPLMLARQGPVIVARDRHAGAVHALEAGADVVLLDDGLQNPALAKSLSIAVVDGATGIGNGCVVPAGPLRAAMRHQWPRVDALVAIGPGAPGEALAAAAGRRGLPVFRAALVPDAGAAAQLKGRRVLAFAGIGTPGKFERTLRQVGATIEAFDPYPDHFPYRDSDLAGLADDARRDALTVVTTQKDAARIGPARIARHFGDALRVLPVALVFEAPDRMKALLEERLGGAQP